MSLEIKSLEERLKRIEETLQEQHQKEKNSSQELEDSYGYGKSFEFFGKKYLTELGRLRANNKFLFFLSIIVSIWGMFMSYCYYELATKESFAVSIPDYGIVEVSSMQANPLYFRLWGDFALTRMANFNPSNVDSKVMDGAKIFDKASWSSQRAYLDKYINVIIKNQITQTFSFAEADAKVKISKDGSRAKVTYIGDASQDIGNLKKNHVKCRYEFEFFIKNGRIFQETASTNCLKGGEKSNSK